jgi:hypothetical protein
MQDMQVARHPPDKGKPYFFHGLRVLWLSAVCECRQDGVPGPSGQTQQKPNRIGVTHMTRGKKVSLAHTNRMLYFFFCIHNRRRLDRYDLTLNVPGPGSAHFKFTLVSGLRSRAAFLHLDVAMYDLTKSTTADLQLICPVYASDFVLSISVIRFGLWDGLVSIKLARLEASATLR